MAGSCGLTREPAGEERPAGVRPTTLPASPEYEAIVAASIPTAAVADATLAAVVPTRLRAREVDLFVDDIVEREGVMVLLGREGEAVVGLVTRASIDVAFPDAKLVEDGFGAAEIAEQTLSLQLRGDCAERVACERLEVALGRTVERGAARVETLGDHDVALVYLDASEPALASTPTLGIRDPSSRVRGHVERASSLYGLSFSLLSAESLRSLREGIPHRSAGGRVLVLAAVAALDPVVHAALGATALVDPRIVARLEQALAEQGVRALEAWVGPIFDRLEMPTPRPAFSSGPEPRLRPRSAVHRGGVELDAAGQVRLGERSHPWLGANPGGAWARIRLAARVARATRGRTALVVTYEHPSGRSPVLVLVPETRTVLNLALLQEGLLGVHDREWIASGLPRQRARP